MKEVTYIGGLAVETASIVVAARVAAEAHRQGGVRGTVTVGGEAVRWSTIQQYEYWNSFERGES